MDKNLIAEIKAAMGKPERLKAGLERQKTHAMLETKETYLGI